MSRTSLEPPRKGPMNRLIAIAVGLALLAACAGRTPSGALLAPETRRLSAEPARAWEIAIQVLTEQGYPLEVRDQEAGLLETAWIPSNPGYRATLFVTEHEDRYSDCGKPGFGRAFQGKDVQLRLQVSPHRRGGTSLTVEARFRSRRYLGAPMAIGAPRKDFPCHSRGRLEDELAGRIQLQVWGEQLDRLRRGQQP